MARPLALPNRQAIRNAVGRRAFSAKELATSAGVARNTAIATISRLEDEGLVEAAGTRKHTNEDGQPTRGRPENVFRVVSLSK